MERLLDRAAETERLQHFVDLAGSGQGSAVVVSGPAGIGKTRLVSHVRETCARVGMMVAAVRCGPLDGELSWSVMRELLDGVDGSSAVRGTSPAELIPSATFAVARAAAERPLLLAVDDIHWADPDVGTCPAGETGTPPNCRMPTAPLRASISLLRGQSPVKHKQIKANVGCSAACYVVAHAQIRIANSKLFSVRSVVVHLRAAGRKQVVLAFSRSQESKLKAALKAHKKVTATVESVLTNPHHSSNQGTSTTAKLKISD
jgi:AAA ATPase domain